MMIDRVDAEIQREIHFFILTSFFILSMRGGFHHSFSRDVTSLFICLYALLPLTHSLSLTAPVRKIFETVTMKPRSAEELRGGIANFYDKSSALWEDIWGEHLHHGYYSPPDRTDHVQAQIDMVDKLLDFAEIKDPGSIGKIVDVGCGLGGATRHLVNRYKSADSAVGITLSPYQEKRGNELCVENGVDRAKVMVADALDMPFEDESFDLVWSLESGEHMPDKKKFVGELMRVAKKTPEKKNKIILCTWVHRDLEEGEAGLRRREKRLLRRINRSYYLPDWCSGQDYVDLFKAAGVSSQSIKREDWSWAIAPFWKAVIRSSISFRSIFGLIKSGPRTIRGAVAMFDMLKGFNQGTIKLAVIVVDV